MTSIAVHLILAHLLVVLGLGADPSPGPAMWPLDPRPEVVEGFAPPVERWGAGHRGVDLLGSPGQSVRAAQAGTVSFAGMLAGRGVVAVGHGSTRTTYEPVDASVVAGDEVRAGQPIGSLRTFGSHCWPASCLHWGLLEGESYLDPLTLVGAGPVRLLPLFSPLPGDSAARPRLPAVPPGPVTAGITGTGIGIDTWGRFLTPVGAPAGRPVAVGPW